MKKIVKILIISVFVLFILPLLAVKTAGMNDMALCFIMFYAINPVFFVTEGIIFGKTVKQHWYIPLITSVIFLFSSWILFDMGESDFVLYAAVYFVIGILAMLISFVVHSLKKTLE